MFSHVKRRIRRYKSNNPYSNQIPILILEGIISISKLAITAVALLVLYKVFEGVTATDTVRRTQINYHSRPVPVVQVAPAIEVTPADSNIALPKDTPKANELRLTRKNDIATGSAGPDWTDEELRSNEFNAICQSTDESIAEISIDRDNNGVAEFTAKCISKRIEN